MSSTGTNTDAAQLGARLREMRETLGFTQAEFAEALRVTDRSVRRYEAGTTTIPSDVVIQMMVLGIDPSYLFGSSDVPAALPDVTSFDEAALREVVAWVDGEWSVTGPMDDFERLTWIVREYLATIRQKQTEPQSSVAAHQRRRKAA